MFNKVLTLCFSDSPAEMAMGPRQPSSRRAALWRRPGHVIAVLVIFIALRTGGGLASDAHGSAGGQGDGPDLLKSDEKEAVGLRVFQVNFHHVEIPFIIGLWIFVSSLAKVGE